MSSVRRINPGERCQLCRPNDVEAHVRRLNPQGFVVRFTQGEMDRLTKLATARNQSVAELLESTIHEELQRYESNFVTSAASLRRVS